MHSQGSRSPHVAPPAGCTKGCSEICEDCSGFDLGPEWDLDAVSAVAAAADMLRDVQAQAADTIRPPEPRLEDRAWLESRLADVAAKIELTLKAQDPAPALERFGERLDNFEARVEAAVDRATAAADRDSLRFIEERVREIDDQFGKVRAQVGRLSTIDARVADIWDHVQLDIPSPTAGLPKLVEAAVSRAIAAANALEAEGADAKADEIDAFARIEDALQRLIERVEAIEVQEVQPSAGHHNTPEDDIELINRAYEEGARALGLILPESAPEPVHRLRALHAAHYAPIGDDASLHALSPALDAAIDRTRHEWPFEAPRETTEPAQSAGEEEPQSAFAAATLDSFKASAMRAKQRAQAMADLLAPRDGEDEGPIFSSQEADDAPEPALPQSPANEPYCVTPPAPAEQSAPARHASASAAAPVPATGSNQEPAEQHQLRASDALRAQPLRPQSLALGESKRSLSQGRWNRGFFASAAALLLCGAAYLTVDRLMDAGEPEARTRTRSLAPQRLPTTGLMQEISGHKFGGPAQLTTPSALTPPEAEDLGTGAEARVASLPATIASASLRHAAANGDAAAEFEIAARFGEGRGVTQDLKQAFHWYQRSATRGFTPAQFRLGAHYERGLGVEKDAERAKVWYRRAAEKGHVKAMHNLAVLLAASNEAADAVRWFREAAERNLPDSQYNLAAFFESGHGVAKNLAEAFKWYSLAARSGDIEAGRRMELVRSQMSRREIMAAEHAVAVWQPTPSAQAANAARGRERAAP